MTFSAKYFGYLTFQAETLQARCLAKIPRPLRPLVAHSPTSRRWIRKACRTSQLPQMENLPTTRLAHIQVSTDAQQLDISALKNTSTTMDGYIIRLSSTTRFLATTRSANAHKQARRSPCHLDSNMLKKPTRDSHKTETAVGREIQQKAHTSNAAHCRGNPPYI
ncbi:hypothetical protein BDY21DRAFT_345238 [Lineolata rhizophorae]|uniref:Uncharacterized protein n=1 Tax=Lineolata rhizophorae TaxID=578093 RepID=A0A6A6P067_9PEZI|nr:hypothetical protein BDY21DRAFT_345238 [Lineolata rhizophorae]